ncbi:MAG: hypothetical protein RIE74_09800 [Pseudomonadales bacterium]
MAKKSSRYQAPDWADSLFNDLQDALEAIEHAIAHPEHHDDGVQLQGISWVRACLDEYLAEFEQSGSTHADLANSFRAYLGDLDDRMAGGELRAEALPELERQWRFFMSEAFPRLLAVVDAAQTSDRNSNAASLPRKDRERIFQEFDRFVETHNGNARGAPAHVRRKLGFDPKTIRKALKERKKGE